VATDLLEKRREQVFPKLSGQQISRLEAVQAATGGLTSKLNCMRLP
jgi:hypothetical protein